jgi:hypothetical protein
VLIPSADPRYYLEFRARLGAVDELDIKDRTGTRLVTVSGLDEMRHVRWLRTGPTDPMLDSRFRFIPSARLLITIPPDQGRLVLRRIDLDEIRQGPLKVLRGEKLPAPKRTAAGLSTAHVDEANTKVPSPLAATLRSWWPGRNAMLGVLAALSYLAVLTYNFIASRGKKDQAPEVHEPGRHRIKWLLTAAAYALTFACIYAEWEAFSGARTAARALNSALADDNREILPRPDLETMIGRTADSTVTEKDGSTLAHYRWKGVVRTYTLRVEFAKGASGVEAMVNNSFE